MAALIIDGFDHYGTVANMLRGVWSTVDSGAGQYSLSTANPRTGTHALRRGTAGTGECIRSLGAEKSVVGCAFGIEIDQLPADDDAYHLIQFRDDGGDNQLTLVLQSDGSIVAKRGGANAEIPSDETVLESEAATIDAGANFYVEALVRFDDTDGAIEVRVNEVTVIHAHRIDTLYTTNSGCSQINLAGCITGDAHGVTADIDDLYAYDDSGNTCNDFIGYRWVELHYPKQDTASEELSVTGTVTGFDAIDDATPDDDSTYLSASSGLPKLSEFELRAVSREVGAISAIQTYSLMRGASTGTMRLSLVSQTSVVDGTDHVLTSSYAYYTDVFPRDPDTGAAWTPNRINAGKLRIRAQAGAPRITQAATLVLVTKTPSLTKRGQLWKIRRRDSMVFAFTTHDEPITWRGITYQPNDSLSSSATDAGIISSGGVGDGQVNGILRDGSITERDLVNGMFDGATVEVWLYPWAQDDYDVPRKLTGGVLGKTTQGGLVYTAELLTPGVKLTQKPLLDLVSPTCRFNDISDPRCPVDAEALRVTVTVTSIEARDAFNRATYRRFTCDDLVTSSIAQADGYWSLGVATWTTGNNAGISSEIKSDAAGQVTLWNAMPFEVEVGDTLSMIPGCDGLQTTHTDKFNLPMASFGGQPHVPGTDALIETPNAKG